MTKIKETTCFLNEKTDNFKPEVAIILGSGLGCFTDSLEGIKVSYKDIPHFGTSTIKGHKGELLFCEIENKKCVVMQGRFHYYEGNSMEICAYPIEVFHSLGVRTLFVTNAAGATSMDYNVGDIMLITDHINFMGDNPLIGKKENLIGDKFPDMSNCYTKEMQELAISCSKEINLNLKQGVYLASSGPSYETKAEVNAFKILGANALGMSSVPEVIMANYLKMQTVAFSMITNHATGVFEHKLSHEEVLQIGKSKGLELSKLIKLMISRI